jgi:ElaB/YqjD/DUF883 family membrane-anchored ribosome-binding protein
MSADHQLQEAYKEWRRLAETEGEAIRTRNWSLVADCQKALQRLQPAILRHTQDAQQEWKSLGLDGASKDEQFRSVIAELIQIESHNNALLQDLQQVAQRQLSQLDRASQTLRQVQRIYAPARPTVWSSFS